MIRTAYRVWSIAGTRRSLAVAVASLGLTAGAAAEILVQYNFEGSNLAASARHESVTAPNFAYTGEGATSFWAGYPDNTGSALRGGMWSSNDTLGAYFSFSVAPQTGFIFKATSVNLAEQRSATGPQNWVIRYSTNGTTFYDVDEGSNGSDDTWHVQTADGTLPLDVPQPLHIRIYGTNASDTSDSKWRVDDVTLNGTLCADTGRRVVRHRGFDGAELDTWAATTNAGGGTITESTQARHRGDRSLRMTGSAMANADPTIQFEPVFLTGASNVILTLAFAATNVDSGDDLYIDITYDDWETSNSVQLVEGFNGADVPFGTTNAHTRVSSNPFVTNLPASASQVAFQVRFDENGSENNTADHYYVDDIRLSMVMTPDESAPVISHYGGVTNITSSSALVGGHVQTGYPYPAVTIYYGPVDGGTNPAAWFGSVSLGIQTWGLFTRSLTGLEAGQGYYYRCRAENSEGSAWASASTGFTTAMRTLAATGRVHVDSFTVNTNMPLSIDYDGNALADLWEKQYFGDSGQDPNAQSDADGVCDGLEFLAGTDPTDDASVMRIMSLDIPSAGSPHIQVTIRGGDAVVPSGFLGDEAGSRQFIVRGVDDDGSLGKVILGTTTTNGSGLNIFTDSQRAASFGSRYYDIGVAFGGHGYTNSEEWGVHVQPRADAHRYMVSVPVDLGTNNTLNGTLGEQLARGLHAGGSTATADRVYWINDDGQWAYFYLLTNDQGTAVWWDAQNLETATVAVTAGRGFWVERLNAGPRARTNAVWAGRSFTNAPALAFRTNHSANGWAWTAFGWPFSTPRRQIDSGIGSTPPNQLGFAELGVGGTTMNATQPHEFKGDQIWVWGHDDRFEDTYWLIEGAGEDLDGRWWNDRTGRFADISLEAGKAFLYRHHVATNGTVTGTNFWWQPSL